MEGERPLSLHPLIDLSNDREVKQAKGFREAAAALTGAGLEAQYQQELSNAPKRHAAGKKYLGNHPGKPATERKNNKDEEHIGAALLRWCAAEGPLVLPRQAGELKLLDYQVPMSTAAVDKDKGDADPNKGVGKLDLLGVGPGNVLTVVRMKYLPREATRGGTGDTPLRNLLEGLALTAMAEANRADIQSEVNESGGPEISDDPPMFILAASPRYWQLCRRREAQKGAAWIKEMERLARDIGEEFGVQVVFLGLEFDGNPEWEYDEEGPVLRRAPSLDPAWERLAGKVRPKAASRPKALDPADIIIEADYSKPVRGYAISESYEAGDRIDHPTLGSGVVQGGAGAGKIVVLFGERKSLLVHERGVQPQPQA